MRLVRLTTGVALLCALLASGLFAGGFENAAVGTKARALGGAFRALADDWTAAYYNPAAYAYALDNQLGASLALVHHRNELTPNYRWGGSYPSGMLNDATLYNKHNILSNPSAGFIVRLPVAGETVFGFSAYQGFDYNIEWLTYRIRDDYNANAIIPVDQYRNNLDVVAFQLSAAKELSEERWALGLGLQVLRGDLLFNNILFRDNPAGAIDPILVDRPSDKIPVWNNNNGFGFGFGVRAGVMYTPSEAVRVGLTTAAAPNVKISGDVLQHFILPDNPTLWRNHPDPVIRNRGSVGQLFVSGETITTRGDFETDLSIPPSLGIGIAYDVSEKLTLTLDGEYTLWSVFDGFEFKYSNIEGLEGPADTSALARNFFTSDVSYEVDWADCGSLMMGAMFSYNEHLTLLAGVAADQSPIREDEQFAPVFVDTGDKYSLNGGILLHIERWDLGFAFSYTHQPDLTVQADPDFGGNEDFSTFPGDYTADTYETVFSFNYRY